MSQFKFKLNLGFAEQNYLVFEFISVNQFLCQSTKLKWKYDKMKILLSCIAEKLE